MNFIDQKIENYALKMTSEANTVCNELAHYTKENVEYSMMLTGKLEGSFLGFLVRLINAREVLEIGTYTGYATLCMASSISENSRVTTLDIDSKVVDIAKKYWKKGNVDHKIKSLIGPALESISKLPQKFDFVFIDADKGNYLNYFKACLDKLNPGGMIAIDNVLWSGKVLSIEPDDSTRAIQQINEYIKNRNDLFKVMLPIRDGLFLVQKK